MPTRSLESRAVTSRADRVLQWRDRRVLPCLCAAAGLHAALTWLGAEPEPALPSPPREVAAAWLGLVPVEVQMPKPAPGPAPGGGSSQPVANDEARAKVEQHSRVQKAPERLLAKTTNDIAKASDRITDTPVDADESTRLPDIVTTASSHQRAAAMATRVSHRPTATATRVAAQQSALAGRRGTGPGANGGPGGPGAGHGNGSGLVTRPFQFGGPSGAFRADVCFIPENTTTLRSLQGCTPQVTFYTDHLDVSPRRFNEGFPGVTTRTEWFAIYFRGSFQVTKPDYYQFRLVSDDGSLLFIDGHLVVDNDGWHPPAIKEGTLPLAVGEHDMRVEYYQGPRDRIALQLFVTGSDGVQKLFGPVL